MTVMTKRFYAPKGRHIVIELLVLSVLSVWVFISYPEYIYIILGRNAKICLNAFRVIERHTPLPQPSDQEKKRATSINFKYPKFGLWTVTNLSSDVNNQSLE